VHNYASSIAGWEGKLTRVEAAALGAFRRFSSIIAGTTDVNNGFAHWTAGCHGSVGFYTEILKAVNIPVRPVWVCGHELALLTCLHGGNEMGPWI
jgi:hypothetical protein